MKKILCFVLCVLMTVTFTACGGTGSIASDDSSISESVLGSTSVEETIKPQDTVTTSDYDTKSEDETYNDEISDDPEFNKTIADLEAKYTNLTTDELKWEYNSSSKTIIISGEGPMRDYVEEAPEWDAYYEEAEHVIIGDDVTSVGADAFWRFPNLVDVKFGEKVEFIGEVAFMGCNNLRTINFPEGLKYVGVGAFSNCLLHSDNGFILPEGLLYLGISAFYSAFKESFVYLPSSVKYIGAYALSNCFVEEFRVSEDNPVYASLDGVLYTKDMSELLEYPAEKTDKNFEIPNAVRKICREAIETNSYLETITIPASVEEIEEGAIFWNYGLKYVYVDENNKNYVSEDGVLYSKDGRKLVCYPIGSELNEYTIKEGTEEIFDYAFSAAGNLEQIHFTEGVKRIGFLCAYLCDNLREIGLPKTLETIEDSAFELCDSLVRVDYAGPSEDWAQVVINEGNDLFTNGQVTVYPAE